jgi:hypothetical protein
MRSELLRNQVADAQTVHENLRDAAYHEAGHVVVARSLGLTIREIEIEEDGSGRADNSGRCSFFNACRTPRGPASTMREEHRLRHPLGKWRPKFPRPKFPIALLARFAPHIRACECYRLNAYIPPAA